MCAETDWMLGRVMDAANRTGHLDNTYIVFVSDHGEMNMEHRYGNLAIGLDRLSRKSTVQWAP